MIKLRLIIAILIGLMLVACDKVGSKAWCEKLEQKSTGSWTVDEVKAAGKPATSLALADGLLKYSERGQE